VVAWRAGMRYWVGVRSLAKVLDWLGMALFLAGLLWIGVVGTASGVPFHGLGLGAVGAAVLLTGLAAVLQRRPPPGGVLPVVFVLAMAWVAGRAMMSPVRHLADLDLMLVGAVTGGFAVVWFTGKVRWILPWLWLLTVAGAVVGVYQLAYDSGFCVLAPLGMSRPVLQKFASGFFYHANPFGTWSAMMLLLSLSVLIFHRGWSFLRVGAAVAAAAAALGLMLSFCRAAFGGFGLGLGATALAVIVAVLRIKGPMWRRVSAGLGVMLVISLVGYGAARWLPHLLEVRGKDSINLAEMQINTEGRVPYWRTGLAQFLEAPLAGTGSRTFSYMSYEHWDRQLKHHDSDMEFVHNEYVQTAAEYGVVGLILLVMLALVALLRAFRVAALLARRDETKRGRAELAWCLGVIGAGMAFLGDVVFSFSGHFAPIALLIGILLGGLAVAGRAVESGKADTKRSKVMAWVSASPMIVLSLLAAVFLLGPGLKYGVAMTRLHIEWAALMRGETEAAEYVEITRRELAALDRHPILIHHAEALRMAIGEAGEDDGLREVLQAELNDVLDRAVEAFPDSIESLLFRAQNRELVGDFDGADADFARAAELGTIREFFYRSWMMWGEARYRRAVAAWYAGDMAAASRMLEEALEAYETSRKLGWVRRDNTRFNEGIKQVQETIALFKRTREWVERPEETGDRP